MKKNFLLTLLAIVCALCCAFGLVACGGVDVDDGKINVSVAQFDNDGIDWIEIYYGEYEEGESNRSYRYYHSDDKSVMYSPIKLDKGKKYYATVAIKIKDDHYIGYDDYLSLEINGKPIYHYLDSDGCYYGNINLFSADIEIEIKGNTSVKNNTL